MKADTADYPSIADKKFSIVITDEFLISAGSESKIIYSNDVSLVK
jgi:hypothetical protein